MDPEDIKQWAPIAIISVLAVVLLIVLMSTFSNTTTLRRSQTDFQRNWECRTDAMGNEMCYRRSPTPQPAKPAP